MKFKGTLILGILCILLLVFVLFVDKPEKKKEEVQKYLFKIDEAKIQQITLNNNGNIIEAKRGDKKWTIVKPVSALANKEDWNSMALTLSSLDYERIVDKTGKDFKTYGLEHPKLIVTFQDDKNIVHRIAFGNENPTGSFCYVRRDEGADVYLVSKYTREKFEKNLSQLRENTALKFDPYSSKSVILQLKDKNIKLAKKHYNWYFEKPVYTRADDTKVEDFLKKCSKQKIADHLDGKKNSELKKIFGHVKYRLTVVDEKGKNKTLEIGARSPFSKAKKEYLAYNVTRDDYFTLPESFIEDLDISINKLRSFDLAQFYPFEVKGITIKTGKKKQVLAKENDESWYLRTSTGKIALDKQKVEDFLSTLRDIKVKKFLDVPGSLDTFGLDSPVHEIVLDIEKSAGIK